MLRVDSCEVGWRIVDGCALLVRRAGGPPLRLSPPATEAWLSGGSIDPLGEDAVRIRPVRDAAELVAPLAVRDGVTSRPVGEGFVVCSPEGALVVLSGGAARIWRRIAGGAATFVDLLDGMSLHAGTAAERELTYVLRRLHDHQLITGFDRLSPFARPQDAAARRPGPESAMRHVGALALMDSGERPPEPPRLGAPAAVREPVRTADHVAIVCQYGIAGLASGVEAYAKRCLERIAALDPDLVVVSGGGRHGLAVLREGESVIERYRWQLPGRALWLENYSRTTWENLQRSLEMLQARSIRPRLVSVVGDRARTEKLRLCCWLARRKFPAFRHVRFRVVPIARTRSTWRDRRVVQLAVGCAQAFGEARRAAPAVPMDVA